MGRPRTYSINENYFENIDSNDKSYILGFIYADGSIYKNYLSIKLSKKDIEILEFIKSELNYGGNIRNYEINNREYVDLTVSSKKIVSDLIKLGVIKNKTYLSKELPLYNKKYEAAFLRGLFDGDGSIYSNNNRGYDEYTICFSSNISVLNQIKTILNNYEISSSNIRHRHNNDESCMLEIRGNINIEKIYNLFYNTNEFYVKRKRERFNEFILMVNSLTRRNLSIEIINEIKILYLSGMKQVKISKTKNILNSTVRTVIQRLRRYGEIE
jgi:hypothetical protein